MSRRIRVIVILLLATFIGYRYFAARHEAAPVAKRASHGPVAATPRMLGHIAFHPCTLAPQLGAASVEAQCGTLSVAENPALPKGRSIALNIAWLPADEEGNNAPDPVFMLAGGPGQSATESYPMVAAAFREVQKNRAVILVDQRGTGKSHPLLCKNNDAATSPADGKAADSSAADSAAADHAGHDAIVACRDALAKNADLRFYTTTDATRDLDAVRAAIGAKQINLLGISYGTRVAQQYARRYPAQTRTLILDSVAPNSLFLGNDFARNLEAALDLQFGRCSKTPGCANTLGDPRQRLNTLMEKLRSDPPLVDYRDAGTGQTHQEKLLPGDVAGLARMYAYAPTVASILPLLLNEAADGRYDRLLALSKMLSGDLAEQMAYGMQLSVICSEDADGLRDDPSMAQSLLGNELVKGLVAQCAVWPHGQRPADFHQPLATHVPALLLSGELDPVTPPAYAQSVAKSLPNARALVLRGQGHNVIGAGCAPKLIAQFLDSANAKTLDTHCLDTLVYTPPFTSFNGWNP